jgi:hypothetical protein
MKRVYMPKEKPMGNNVATACYRIIYTRAIYRGVRVNECHEISLNRIARVIAVPRTTPMLRIFVVHNQGLLFFVLLFFSGVSC